MEEADEVDPVAQQIGAVNTLVRQPDGRLKGFNTDWSAAISAIEAGLLKHSTHSNQAGEAAWPASMKGLSGQRACRRAETAQTDQSRLDLWRASACVCCILDVGCDSKSGAHPVACQVHRGRQAAVLRHSPHAAQHMQLEAQLQTLGLQVV